MSRPDRVWLMAGPEGGFEPEETEAAVQSGWQPLTLGPRVLRAETAPLAALAAVIAPEIVMSNGQLINSLADARLPALAASVVYFFYKRSILGTIALGMAIYLPLHIGLGW